MDYVIAIPTYRRSDSLQSKTLSLFKGLPNVYVFVANEEEYNTYRAAIDPTYYKEMIVGVVGLIPQRQFIIDYFPKDTFILYADDDLVAMVRRVNEKTLERVDDVGCVIREGFAEMVKAKANIWGLYSNTNPFYMKPTITTDLKFIIGNFYGIRNTKDPKYRLHYEDGQEDKERCIRYWLADKCMVRLNSIAIKTKMFSKGGLETPTRKADTEKSTERFVVEFPTLVFRVYKKVGGFWDLKFKRTPAN
jgi:hypothetical protein